MRRQPAWWEPWLCSMLNVPLLFPSYCPKIVSRAALFFSPREGLIAQSTVKVRVAVM